MTRLALRFRFDKAVLASIVALLVCAGGAPPSRGAVSAPSVPNADAEAKFKLDCWAAENSMLLRNQVARERYQKKLERRAAVVAALKAELAMKKQTITINGGPVDQPSGVVPADPNGQTAVLVWIMLMLAAILPVRYFWKRPALEPLRTIHDIPSAASKQPVQSFRQKAAQAQPVKPAVKPAAKPAATSKAPSSPAPVRPVQKPQPQAPGADAPRAGQPKRQRPVAWVLSS